jgi:HPt (histidine-containing phosphotransfer) domain-containing protein
MSQRLNAYFVKEAREYLEQMEAVLGGEGARPDTDQLVRLARGVRGSAQMAGASGVGSVTERLESVARSLATQVVPWNDRLRDLFLHTVHELRSLLEAVDGWGDAERNRVRALLGRWDLSDQASAEEGEAAPATDRVVPISSLFYDDAGPHVISPGGAGGAAVDGGADGVVPIEALLLRGSAAARAALALRPRLDQMLASGASSGDLAQVHDEIFDLLELSLSEATA